MDDCGVKYLTGSDNDIDNDKNNDKNNDNNNNNNNNKNGNNNNNNNNNNDQTNPLVFMTPCDLGAGGPCRGAAWIKLEIS